MQIRSINAKLAAKPASAYSQALEVSGAMRTLFISGQLGMDLDGTTPAGIEERARLAWRNLGFQLEAAGMTFDNLVKVTMYFTDPVDITASRPARAAALGNRRPASTVVAALAHPSWKIEVEAVACG
jgi:enamine deaminase RidA (YjgF/YER057c/UK114 family)